MHTAAAPSDAHFLSSLPPALTSRVETWGLIPDGDPILTPTSHLLPVLCEDRVAMLKVAIVDEERAGAAALIAWGGRGAARVYLHDDDAIVMERATSPRSLRRLAESGGSTDDEATRVLARAVAQLHGLGCPAPRGTVALNDWFADLFVHADERGGFYMRAAYLARELLDHPRDEVLLHGDVHHANVLDFGPERGWLAIDPKGLVGEPAFDYGNILCNPTPVAAAGRGRAARQLATIAEISGIEERHLARWGMAWCALSSAWIEREPGETSGNDQAHAASTLAVGRQLEEWLAG